jgi:hypothetical protein
MPWYKDVSFGERYDRETNINENDMAYEIPCFICYETDHAFAHWVYEDFIYICHPDGLPESVTSIWDKMKIHAVWPKEYKTPFLESIGIPKNRQVSGKLPIPNYCWFPESQLLLNQNIAINEIWLDRFEKWVQQQKEHINLFHFLILPRQSKESYHANDRRVHIEPIIEYVQDEMKKQNFDLETELILYHTDKMTNIKEQIQIVGGAINIILDAASSYFVNGMFANNASIFSIGPWRHHEQFAIMGQIHNRIASRNVVHWIDALRVEPGHDYHDASKISAFYSASNNNDWREPINIKNNVQDGKIIPELEPMTIQENTSINTTNFGIVIFSLLILFLVFLVMINFVYSKLILLHKPKKTKI